MGSLEEHDAKTDIRRIFSDEEDSGFRRRVHHQGKCAIPRRYVIAIMLSFALVIEAWRYLNISYMLAHIVFLEHDVHTYYPALSNWTVTEMNSYFHATLIGDVCIQFPGALLIFMTSSYKFLTASVATSSALHLLILVSVDHHSIFFVAVILAQRLISGPNRVAILSMWKEWAPPGERTKLITITFGGAFLTFAATPLFIYILEYDFMRQSFYLSGACGLIWSLFWYSTISDTPSNDPKISDRELLYLQNNISSAVKETSKLSQVPWKSILTSKPVLALYLVYYKASSSLFLIMIVSTLFIIYFLSAHEQMAVILIPVLILLFVPFLAGSAITADLLIKKFRGHALIIRKSFLCGAFSVHAVLLFVTLFLNNTLAIVILLVLSFLFLSTSVAGFYTIPLDLSSRYITITGGLIETFFALGFSLTQFMADHVLNSWEPESFRWIFLHEIIVAILAAGIFYRWGSNEEQPWSFNSTLGRPSINYQSYPKPEDEDDLKLVTDYM